MSHPQHPHCTHSPHSVEGEGRSVHIQYIDSAGVVASKGLTAPGSGPRPPCPVRPAGLPPPTSHYEHHSQPATFRGCHAALVWGGREYNTNSKASQTSPPSPPLPPSPHPRHFCTTWLQSGVLFCAQETQETQPSHVLTEVLQITHHNTSQHTTANHIATHHNTTLQCIQSMHRPCF